MYSRYLLQVIAYVKLNIKLNNRCIFVNFCDIAVAVCLAPMPLSREQKEPTIDRKDAVSRITGGAVLMPKRQRSRPEGRIIFRQEITSERMTSNLLQVWNMCHKR